MYDFKTLSPLDFEDLVRDLLQAEMSVTFESFGPGRDLGIDCRYAQGTHRIVVQAKHLAGSSTTAIVTAAKNEHDKIRKISPTRYILATSLSLTPQLKTRIRAALPDVPLVEGDILGHSELNNLLKKYPLIERQHFKLWLASSVVLDRILHSGVYNRTAAEMEIVRKMIPRYVPNASTSEAESILAKTGSLIVAGQPGVGKTTLARILLWLHAEQGWKIYVVDDIKEAYEIADGNERRLILFDDFLGQVRLSLEHLRSVDQGLPRLLERTRTNKNLRFILTTRDYILRQAQFHAQRLDPAHLSANELVLNVGAYTRGIRARILYNHMFHSALSSAERNQILADDFYLKIIDHKNFNPRLIDMLTSADYVTVSSSPICTAITAVLDNPQTLWEKPYRSHLSDEGRAQLLALFFNRPEVAIVTLQSSFERTIEAMGLAILPVDRPVRFRAALKEVEGSFVAIADRKVRFSNPGVRDFIGRVIAEDNYLPHALKTLAEYDEVHQAWTYFKSLGTKPTRVETFKAVWALAVEKMLSHGSGSVLQRFMLVLDMYNDLQSDELLSQVRRTLQDVEQSEPDECDASECVAAVEAAVMSLLPIDDLGSAKHICCKDVAARLSSNGILLTLDDIKSVANALIENGSDPATGKDAAHDALIGFIAGIDDSIRDIHTLTELEEFAREITSMMTDYGVYHSDVERELDYRRGVLEEREAKEEPRRYAPQAPIRATDATDGEIRSMFQNLKQR